jgi:hypothetical protein
VVVGVAIVLIVVLVMIIKAAAGGGDDGKKAATTPSTSPLPSLTTTAPPAVQAAPCTRTGIDVEAEATASSFAAGVKPAFLLNVTNNGTVSCVVDPDTVSVVITSGSDQIFDSAHQCGGESGTEETSATESEGLPAVEDDTPSDEEILDELDSTGADSTGATSAATGTATATGTDPAADARAGAGISASAPIAPGTTGTVPYTWSRERSDENCEPFILQSAPQPGTYHAAFSVAGVEAEDLVFSLG